MLPVLAGVVVLALTALDVVLTVLAPVRRGPVSRQLSRAAFAVLRRLAQATRPALLTAAGPLGVVLTLATWVLGALLGFALVLWPVVDELAFSPEVDFGRRGFADALYFSGATLTSVGFGDVVAGTDRLRLLAIAEAGAGFAVLSGGITYVLSLYPRVSLLRSNARALQSAADDPARAAALVVDGGPAWVTSLTHQVLDLDEQTERFPTLHLFHAGEPAASMDTFARGAGLACVQARWALAPAAAPYARTLGDELRGALEGMAEHYAARFMRREGLGGALDEATARRRLQALVAAAGAAGDPRALDDPDEVAAFARFAGPYERYLEHLAGKHLREHRPLA